MVEYNDYELVALAKEGNEDAINLIYLKYKPLIVSKSKDSIARATHHGIEINDIIQEGYIGLEEAINDFSEDDNTSFYTFAMLCINRQIINYIRKTTAGRDKILNDAIAIDDYVDNVFIKDDFDIEFSIISKDNEKNIITKIKRNLTEFENKVFDMKIDGYNFLEIANNLNRDIKSVYNTFQRIKIKIKKIIDDDDYLY